MITRSTSCKLMQTPLEEDLISLTDQLMCIVNQKLRETHKAANVQNYGECFEILYLDRDLTMTEMQIAVMNVKYLHENAVAVPESRSMIEFLKMLKLFRFVDYISLNSYRLQGFRFVKMPKDYCKRNHCLMFDDLAIRYNGAYILAARDLSKCMLIWELESWLTDTCSEFSQPRASCWVLYGALQSGFAN